MGDDDFYDDFEPDYDEGLDADGYPIFECAVYVVAGKLYCPMAGTEECDWDCPG